MSVSRGSRISPAARILVCLLVLLGLPGPVRGEVPLSEDRGKQIYFEGKSPAGRPITAYVGRRFMEVPGAAMKCAACHGVDGLGNPESGVIPSNITWSYLTKPYGVTHAYGRTHPPYTEETLVRAIASGIDPSGNILDHSMPRYLMSDQDMADLVAYLKRLESDLDPGIGAASLVIGTMLPMHGERGELGVAMKAVLEAYFAEINATGGIYQRSIVLRTVDTGSTAGDGVARLNAMLGEGDIFALAGVYLRESGHEITEFVERNKVPLVGPFGLYTPDPNLLTRYTFYLLAGFREQVEVLVDSSVERLGGGDPGLALITDPGLPFPNVEDTLQKRFRRRGWKEPVGISLVEDEALLTDRVRALAEKGARSVLFLGRPGLLPRFLEAASRVNWRPEVLVPGALVGQGLFGSPREFSRRIFLSYPTLPRERTLEGVKELQMLRDKYNLTKLHPTAQEAAFCAAKVLVEGLKRAGRAVSREKLVRALEGLYQFTTGFTPPVTFGLNRRVGSIGSYIMVADLERKDLIPAEGWRTPR